MESSWKSKAKHFIHDFVSRSSLHGMSYIVTEKQWISKIFWMIMIISSGSLGIYNFLSYAKEYRESAPQTGIESTVAPLNDITFPTISICNIYRIRESFLRWIGIASEDKHSFSILYHEFIEGRTQNLSIEDEERLGQLVDKMMEKTGFNMTSDSFLNIATQKCEDMNLYATFRGIKRYFFSAFKSITSDNRLCCTISTFLEFELENKTGYVTGGGSFLDIPKGGALPDFSNGLEILVDSEVYNIGDIDRGSAGLKVSLNYPTNKPRTLDAIVVAGGGEYQIAMVPNVVDTSQSALVNYSPEERKCYNDSEFQLKYYSELNGYEYSYTNCLLDAAIHLTIEKCKCIPQYATMLEHSSVAGDSLPKCVGMALNCANKARKIEFLSDSAPSSYNVQTERMEKCMSHCKDIKYDTLVSQARFPTMQTFLQRREFCVIFKKILKVCSRSIQKKLLNSWLRYEFLGEKGFGLDCPTLKILHEQHSFCSKDEFFINEKQRTLLMDEYPEVWKFMLFYTRNNVALLRIYFKDPYYTKIVRDQSISLRDFIGTAGGVIGLFLGFSVLSLVEFIYHLVKFFITLPSK